MCCKSFSAHMGCTASTDSHAASIGSGGSVFGTSRGGEGAVGGFRDYCGGRGTEVGLVMILVVILVATGVEEFFP